MGKNISTRRNVEFNTYFDGIIEIGDNCFFNSNCILTSHTKISIGKNSSFGPNVVVYDHDHDYKHSDGRKGGHYKSMPINIGNNVWIGANCIILKGAKIEDNAVIAAGTIVRGYVEKNTLVYSNNKISSIKY